MKSESTAAANRASVTSQPARLSVRAKSSAPRAPLVHSPVCETKKYADSKAAIDTSPAVRNTAIVQLRSGTKSLHRAWHSARASSVYVSLAFGARRGFADVPSSAAAAASSSNERRRRSSRRLPCLNMRSGPSLDVQGLSNGIDILSGGIQISCWHGADGY